MSYSYVDRLRDGRIVLYTRSNSPILHARFNVEGVKGYIVKSTKTSSLAEAVRKAEETYDDLRYKVRHNLEVRPYTFGSLYAEWLKSNQNRLSEHRLRYISGTASRYLLPFFGDRSLEDIDSRIVEQYWVWRTNYWTSEEGVEKRQRALKSRTTVKRPYKQKLGNVALLPSQKTLEMEQSALRQIFKWANRMGISNRMPEIKAPRIASPGSYSRRPAFSLSEWQRLYRYLRQWVKEDGAAANVSSRSRGGKGRPRPTSLHRLQREMLRHYVLFMAMSGLRPNEARQLRWRDLSTYVDDDGVEHLIIHVAPSTKTGSRECVPLRAARGILERLKTVSPHIEPEDYVFCAPDGGTVDNFGKTFKKLLGDAGLLVNQHDQVRTIYSLRHTYATFRLLYGNARIDDLARNMGTSPSLIYRHYSHVTVYNRASELGGKLHQAKSRKGLYF